MIGHRGVFRLGVATAATDALREDRRGILALSRDVASVIDGHLGTVAAVARRATDHEIESRSFLVEAGTEVDVGVTAATADGLREDAVARDCLRCQMSPDLDHVHRVAVARTRRPAPPIGDEHFAFLLRLLARCR